MTGPFPFSLPANEPGGLASLDRRFNLTNNDADQQFGSGGQQINSPNYGLLTNRQLPRSAQGVVRLQC